MSISKLTNPESSLSAHNQSLIWTMSVRKTLLDGIAYVGRCRQQQKPHERLQLVVLRQYKDLLKQTKFLFDQNARFQCSHAQWLTLAKKICRCENTAKIPGQYAPTRVATHTKAPERRETVVVHIRKSQSRRHQSNLRRSRPYLRSKRSSQTRNPRRTHPSMRYISH